MHQPSIHQGRFAHRMTTPSGEPLKPSVGSLVFSFSPRDEARHHFHCSGGNADRFGLETEMRERYLPHRAKGLTLSASQNQTGGSDTHAKGLHEKGLLLLY